MTNSEPAQGLSALLPPEGAPPLSSDEVLSLFVGHVEKTGMSLYPAQEEALLELMSGKHVILNTPTGSGKSLVAAAFHFKALAEGKVSVYTSPIKALVNEKFFALCELFGASKVGMLTGDASINADASILCCTAEVLSNLCLRRSELPVHAVVMDEFHYYADKDRGVAWQLPLLTLDKATFLLMSATLGDMSAIAGAVSNFTHKEVAWVRSAERPVPLDFEYRETPLHETLEDLVARGKAPIYLVNFTQRSAAEEAQNLMSVYLCSKEEKEAIRLALMDAKFDSPYGKDFQRYLRHGLGLHHAGLLPKYRLLTEKLAQNGMLKVISGTDTLGVGVNIPIRTVLFTKLCKFGGEKVSVLSVRDFHQISGRAGRKGFDERGSVVAQAPEHVVENLRMAQKEAQGKKKGVKKTAPTKGYAHWDKNTFDRLQTGQPEPLESRFQVTHGMLLQVLQSAEWESYRRLVKIILRSHERPARHKTFLKQAAAAFRTLRNAGIVEVIRGEQGWPSTVRVSPGLQDDFSLTHTLALYLVDTLDQLDPQSPQYALDVVTLVESILESPDVVLWAQLDQLKGEKVAELKAAGVEYEERMQELEKLEHPKPNAEFIYGTFNLFAQKHPWIGQENIRPKSILRDMLERFCTFHDYVREYGLERSEGVLLRYLTDAYKTLDKTVPSRFKDAQVDDIITHLRLLLRQVDSSLVDEWESLTHGRPLPKSAAPPPARVLELWQSPRALAARLRSELHRLTKALADKNFAAALALLRAPEGTPPEQGWTAERLEAAMTPYFQKHARIDTSPAARKPPHSFIEETSPRIYRAQQKLFENAAAEEGEGGGDWLLNCTVDFTQPVTDDEPLLQLNEEQPLLSL